MTDPLHWLQYGYVINILYHISSLTNGPAMQNISRGLNTQHSFVIILTCMSSKRNLNLTVFWHIHMIFIQR